MNQISLREFQLHASKYLDKLPIVLTQYNIPIVVVSKVNQETTYVKSVNTPILKPVLISSDVTTQKRAHCDAPFCKSIEGILVQGIGYTDEGEVKKRMYLCKFHIARARRNNEEIKKV